MKRFFQISLAHLMLIISVASAYYGLRFGNSFDAVLRICGFNVAATIAFFLLDTWQRKPEDRAGWELVIRPILAGWITGIMIGFDITEGLRQMEYWNWSQDWLTFVGWVLVQLTIAIIAYGISHGTYTMVRVVWMARGNAVGTKLDK